MKKILFAIPFLTLVAAAQHKPERDPFVNLASQKAEPAVVLDAGEHRGHPVISVRAHPQPVTRVTIAPKLTVIGLVTNSRQPKAIVAGEKSTYIVSQGDKLGDYRVAKIDRSGITLAFKDQRFHRPLGQ